MTNKLTQTQKASKDDEDIQVVSQGRALSQDDASTSEPLEIPSVQTVHELALLIGVAPVEVIKQLMRHGYMLTINDVVEQEIAVLVAQLFGHIIKPPSEEVSELDSLVISTDGEDASQLETRSPVVTILGHVDHGKTTLLDSIRKSSVVAGEAGGITQHIGAYQVDFNGNSITFLDTPGHEAFTAMRARGAQITDVAVLVVAADDGVMPQTVEAINHVKAAEVPIIAAINKIDHPNADIDKVKRQLSEHDLLVEDWGGDVIAVPVSALKGDGIPDLLENIMVVAEIGELKANPHRLAKGIVIEARIDKSKGPVATVLVQTGTLHIGDIVVAGCVRGRVRAMLSDQGERVKLVGPSSPSEILGLSGLPQAGDAIVVVPDKKSARVLVEENERKDTWSYGHGTKVTLEEIHTKIESGEVKGLDLIIKTDVQGSIDAVLSALRQLSIEQTRVNLIHAASGSITESDVLLAMASKAIIIGFNSHPEPGARSLANQAGIDIRFYDIIYNLIDDVEKALQGLLTPATIDVLEGYATVRAVFTIGRKTKVAGIYVNNGRISRGVEVRVVRNGEQIFAGSINSLKHFKDDVREIATGLEGGIVVDGFQDCIEGDIIEAYRTEQTE